MSERLLTSRWTRLRPHPVQLAYRDSPHRFNVVPAGRRSGKTERAKRKLVRRALRGTRFYPARFFAAAPTRDQAKRIYWDDLLALVPKQLQLDVRTGDLMIRTPLSEIWVLGMDKPERIEGHPWDGGILDEYANMKERAWTAHVRPALSDRLGWCDLIGVPEGRNHYYDRWKAALAEMQEKGAASEWGAYTWVSADILPPAEVEAARRDLDELTFQQEYEASFVSFSGRAYYKWNEAKHGHRLRDRYRPDAPLIVALDFNVDPGVAAIGQEMLLPNGELGTGWIGEVHIPVNSNTVAICRRIVQDWGRHQGHVYVHGDATGGARKSSQTEGSDWDLVRQYLRPTFGERLHLRNRASNPSERARINSVNTRLENASGVVRMMVDPYHCPTLVRDFEGVRVLAGGSGEIDKKADPKLSHISDAVGYYVEDQYPVSGPRAGTFIHRV